jgi:TolB-like protein
MNIKSFITLALAVLLCDQALAQTQDMDTELASLAEKLATPIKDHGNKKVTVIDFTDLQGGTSGELGKYIAEQLTINLVMGKRDFSVLDRANLKSILAEHKLTATGLVNPDNAKKLGMFAGVDAIILGSIIPKGQNISLTVKIITTETAEIIGAARAEFKVDQTVKDLMSKPPRDAPAGSGGALSSDGPIVVKKFGDLRVELQPLRIVNGNEFLLTMSLNNENTKRSIWMALNLESMFNVKGQITDVDGSEFKISRLGVSGIELNQYQQYHYQGIGFKPATEISPNDSVTATVKFVSTGKSPALGRCRLQLELLLARDNKSDLEANSVHNLVTDIDAN